jgi:hypothetical protein
MIDITEFTKLTLVFLIGAGGGFYFGREFLVRHLDESIEALGGFFTSYGVYRATKDPEPEEKQHVLRTPPRQHREPSIGFSGPETR